MDSKRISLLASLAAFGISLLTLVIVIRDNARQDRAAEAIAKESAAAVSHVLDSRAEALGLLSKRIDDLVSRMNTYDDRQAEALAYIVTTRDRLRGAGCSPPPLPKGLEP